MSLAQRTKVTHLQMIARCLRGAYYYVYETVGAMSSIIHNKLMFSNQVVSLICSIIRTSFMAVCHRVEWTSGEWNGTMSQGMARLITAVRPVSSLSDRLTNGDISDLLFQELNDITGKSNQLLAMSLLTA